jgi:hypothetical protein
MKGRREGILGRLIAVICLLTALLPAAEAQDRATINRVKELLLAGKPTIGAICQLPSLRPWRCYRKWDLTGCG